MANIIYPKAKQALWNAQINVSADNIKALLVDSADYTLDSVNDEFLSDIPSLARVSTSPNLVNVTNVNGLLDADDTTFTGVTGDQSEVIVLYKDTTVDTTSRLIAYIDTGTGLAVTPNGGDISVTWNASGIIQL